MKYSQVLTAIAFCVSLAFAQFDDDEWADFDYQHAGLSQIEFQNIKRSGMSKEKLLHLLEIGVRPSEYLREPWNELGVSESEWLSERAGGMEDADIDRTYKNRHGNQGFAYLSFLVPSLYQWMIDDMVFAIAMDVSYVAAWTFTILALNGKERVQFGVPLIVAIHVWSGIDALVATMWDSNPDVKNFSWGIMPTGKGSFAAAATLKF